MASSKTGSSGTLINQSPATSSVIYLFFIHLLFDHMKRLIHYGNVVNIDKSSIVLCDEEWLPVRYIFTGLDCAK